MLVLIFCLTYNIVQEKPQKRQTELVDVLNY